MAKVELISYRVTELSLNNRCESGETFHFSHRVSYRVQHRDGGICVGELDVASEDGENKKITLNYKMQGIFRFSEKEEQEDAHKLSYRILFPLAQATLAAATAALGMPPIRLPYVDLDDSAVYRVDIRPPQNGN